MKKLVVLSGAGVSAESGISTFRGADGLWEGHDIMDVASPVGWAKNRDLVLEFYNQRRKQLREVVPNAAHIGLAALEKHFEVSVITQNVDDLHERGGSSRVMHLHGELRQSRSTADPSLIYDLGDKDIVAGDMCEKGSQLRPNIVWFGEAVPMMDRAIEVVAAADIFVVVGTSMVVYPAASLIHYVAEAVPKYIIDPNTPALSGIPNLTALPVNATEGVVALTEMLLK